MQDSLSIRTLVSRLTAGVVLVIVGCAETTPLERVTTAIDVTPRSMLLPEVPEGVRSEAPLTITNTGVARLTLSKVSFEGDPVFSTAGPLPEQIPANQAVELTVVGLANSTGEYTGTLILTSNALNEPEVRVSLTFNVVPTPQCDDGNACTNDRFDPTINACINEFADGTPCQSADRCIIDAVCQLGVCLGRQKTCDDNSLCTEDFCRQTDGECLFIPNETACDDGNPCTADACGENGCIHEPLINGTACEDGDFCTTQDACFAGVCVGRGRPNGGTCDDGDSCTVDDRCFDGVCQGESLITAASEGDVVFTYPLVDWPERAFLHRRHVSMSDDGVFYGLDHLNLPDNQGLTHVVFAMQQCGTPVYNFAYRPPDPFVSVLAVRRSIQVTPTNDVRMVVGVRQLVENGFTPQTTTYLLDPDGRPVFSAVRALGGETGRSLLPDGSQIWGTIVPLNEGPYESFRDAEQNHVIVRSDRFGNPLWTNARESDWWAEFLGVAGPRVLFWSQGRFGALDFNTGALVWSQPTAFITQEIALSTQLDLGVARASEQILAVEILNGTEVFTFPATPDPEYVPRTDPVISADGRILVMMERRTFSSGATVPLGLSWVELDLMGNVLSETLLDYTYPFEPFDARAEDRGDDPYPTVADDGVAYVGYGDTFWAIEPGGGIRWTLTSTLPDAFTATVPLLRDDGVLLMSLSGREIIGVKTNGGLMSDAGWASYRHDNDRTNFTP